MRKKKNKNETSQNAMNQNAMGNLKKVRETKNRKEQGQEFIQKKNAKRKMLQKKNKENVMENTAAAEGCIERMDLGRNVKTEDVQCVSEENFHPKRSGKIHAISFMALVLFFVMIELSLLFGNRKYAYLYFLVLFFGFFVYARFMIKLNRNDMEILLKERDEAVALEKELHIERTQYRDALTKDCIFSLIVDLTDGYLRKDMFLTSGESFLEYLHVKTPVLLNDVMRQTVTMIDRETLEGFEIEKINCEDLIAEYQRGNSQIEFEYYNTEFKAYQRMTILISENCYNGHYIACMYCKDVTESKKRDMEIKEALRKSAETAAKASAAKTEFLSTMSHDIRTPMNAIMGMTKIAKNHIKDPERVLECLDKIEHASDHLHTLVNDVLDISAIESGNFHISPSKTNLHDIIENITAVIKTQMYAKSISFTLNCHDIYRENLMVDGLRLNQIYLNLLSNATKYTEAGGKVEFEIWQEPSEKEGYLFLHGVVKDNGIGMTKEFMERVFTRFSRAVDTRVSNIEGTGLGLMIVKNLVDAMNGTIKVESELGVGSTFRVTLECMYAECCETAKEEKRQEEAQKNLCQGAHVLLAEDNDLNFEIAQDLLESCGVNIERAEDGEICVDKFLAAKEGTYDCIFMDLQMPNMDGIEATKKIRSADHSQAKTIPIIAMTANAFAEDVEKCRQAGMQDHLSKPIDFEKVLSTIAKYRNTK